MDLQNLAITYIAYMSCALFVAGVALLSFVTFRVANWLTMAEYDQWIEDDIAQKDVKQKKERKEFEEKISTIEKLKKNIKKEEEKQSTGTKSKDEKDNKKVDKEEEDEDKDSMTAEEKHKADIKAILNLPTY